MKTNDPKVVLKELLLQNREQSRSIDEQLSKLTSKRKQLDAEYITLNESYRIVGGEPFQDISEQRPIADMVEEVLRLHEKLHVDSIRDILAAPPYNRVLDKQSIVGTLVRYVSQHKRFQRVGKNTFALLEGKKEENPM